MDSLVDESSQLKSVCVFCGSNPGINGRYAEAADELGGLLARSGIQLVYGGGATGIMGAVANGALRQGGRVIGVLPSAMQIPGVAHEGLNELQIVPNMHARKARMAELADAFIALPGGMGTLEELFEVLTWSQLGYQPKPIGILNLDGYYDPLLDMVDHMIEQGFVRSAHRAIFAVAIRPQEMLPALNGFRHPVASKWTEIEGPG
ncbi:MAG: TIGR00730 family Rossman fold protein [Caldilineales bacterium]|nr:TIGR00730 family Rossman fold protein [Caldilineales bacterium]